MKKYPKDFNIKVKDNFIRMFVIIIFIRIWL